jgi:hypothetical protein
MIGQVAKLRSASGEELCLVRFVAERYLTVQIYSVLQHDEALEIEMSDGSSFPARVHSQNDSIAVLCCDVPEQDRAFAETAPPAPTAFSPRAPRVELNFGVRIGVAGEQRLGTLINISQGGARIRAAGLTKGMKVTLLAGGLPPLAGRLRWSEAADAGLSFYAPLDFDLLARWTASVIHHFPA